MTNEQPIPIIGRGDRGANESLVVAEMEVRDALIKGVQTFKRTDAGREGEFWLWYDTVSTRLRLQVWSHSAQAWNDITGASGTGSITSGGTTDVITHGLGTTPTISDITITWGEQGTNDYGRWWVDTFTSTQFTVNVSADPGASNLDFGWQAVVR